MPRRITPRVIFDKFCKRYPSLAKKVIYYHLGEWPRIDIYIEDGGYFSYDYIEDKLKVIDTQSDEDPFEEVGDEIDDESYKSQFAENLYGWMKSKRIHATDLARSIGVSRKTVQRYLKGESLPDALTLFKMSRIFRCDVNELVGWTIDTR